MNSRLKSLAYGMLGSMSEAEDMVQEAYLRLHQLETPPESEAAFLYRVTSNLCIDRLRRARTEREAYYGPWLPEPAAEADLGHVELAQELTMGMLLLLEQLTPAERVAFVLREAFDFSYHEVAAVLDVSVANARQRTHRARKRLQDERLDRRLPDDRCKALLEQLVGTIVAGDVNKLASLLTEDVVSYADGGGVVSAAMQPVYGRERIAQVTLHLANKALAEGGTDLSLQRLNGTWALLVRQHGQPHSLHFIEGSEHGIERLYTVRNPQKLRHLKFGSDQD